MKGRFKLGIGEDGMDETKCNHSHKSIFGQNEYSSFGTERPHFGNGNSGELWSQYDQDQPVRVTI